MASATNLALKASPFLLLFLLPSFAFAASPNQTSNGPLSWTPGAVRMNHIQVIGTHNSYHREAPLEEHAAQAELLPNVRNYYYSHPSLAIQAAHQSIRSFELDIFADPDGGHYATQLVRRRSGANLLTPTTPDPDPDPELLRPGIKVLHVADADYHTTCKTLVSCLEALKSWSTTTATAATATTTTSQKRHAPIPIMIEFKTSDAALAAAGGAAPIPWDDDDNHPALLDGLDEEIRSVFAPEDLVTPDDLRRGGGGDNMNLTLEQSVLQRGWPDLDSARGRFMFLMDNERDHPVYAAYTAGRPNLEGRVLFTNSVPGQPDCAFQKLNDPTGAQQDHIRAQVEKGYWVRTRADVPLDTLFSDNVTAMREAAFASGAHVVSTDFQAYGMSSRWDVDYAVRFPGGAAARCIPFLASGGCDDSELIEG